MSPGPKRSLAAAVAILTLIGVACSNASPATAPSTPQEQAAVAPPPAPAVVAPVPPAPAAPIVPVTASTPRPTNTPGTSAGPTSAEPTATTEPAAFATTEPNATAEPVVVVQEATSSPVPTTTSVPATSTPPPPSPTPEAEAADATIISSKIENFSFEDLEVGVGTIVSWFNKDGAPHTVTAGSSEAPDPGVFNSGALSKGEQYSFVFHEAGSYQFYCVFHPRMVGTITVVDSP